MLEKNMMNVSDVLEACKRHVSGRRGSQGCRGEIPSAPVLPCILRERNDYKISAARRNEALAGGGVVEADAEGEVGGKVGGEGQGVAVADVFTGCPTAGGAAPVGGFSVGLGDDLAVLIY